MKKKNRNKDLSYKSTTALVFDRVCNANTKASSLIFERALLAAAISFLGTGYIFLTYGLPVNYTAMSLAALGFSAAFSLLFSITRRYASIIVMTIVSGGLILLCFDSFWGKFSYFVDGIILECSGSMFDFTSYTIHRPFELFLSNGAPVNDYVDGVIFGSVILCALFAILTTAGLMGKPNIMPSLVFFLMLWTPPLMAEKLYFNWRLIPLTALYAGTVAISVYYRDGLAIRHVYAAGGYRRKIAIDQKRFNKAVKLQSASQKIASRGLYYSKYFSSVTSAAAMFAALGIVFSAVFIDSKGVDYTWLYEKIQSLDVGFDLGISPFKSGAESKYFTSSSYSPFHSNDRLRLTSPSRSTKAILHVTKSITEKPLYLRGDIGIDFDGASWNSPVTDEPRDWAVSGLKDEWQPKLPSGFESYGFELYGSVAETVRGSVEYLCDTDVIFSPAYDVTLAAYNRPNTDIFGDFAARRQTGDANGDVMNFTAFVPSYLDASDEDDFNVAALILTVCQRLEQSNIEQNYSDYVKQHYLSVSEEMKSKLEDFTSRVNLSKEIQNFKEHYEEYAGLTNNSYEVRTKLDSFYTAAAISEFLKSNYTYSLDARINSRDPVMSFLNDTKSGHCALYASSMTLLLRNMGIPARYCTGFAASADSAFQTLRSKDLHAWCEVYFDELGWVTFDPTAASALGGQNSGNFDESASSLASGFSESSESVIESGVNSSMPVLSEQSSETHESVSYGNSGVTSDVSDALSYNGQGGQSGGETPTFAEILPYILKVLIIAVAIALIVLMIAAYNDMKKRAYKRIQGFRHEQSGERAYAKILGIMRLCKLAPRQGEQPHDFFSRAEEKLNCSFCDNYELLQKLAFGSAELDAEERAQFVRVFETIYKAAEKKLFFIGKIRLRLLVLKKR